MAAALRKQKKSAFFPAKSRRSVRAYVLESISEFRFPLFSCPKPAKCTASCLAACRSSLGLILFAARRRGEEAKQKTTLCWEEAGAQLTPIRHGLAKKGLSWRVDRSGNQRPFQVSDMARLYAFFPARACVRACVGGRGDGWDRVIMTGE